MIIFHADDYGLSENVSNEILSLVNHGMLDGLSVIINMKHSEQALRKLLSAPAASNANRPLRICLHLNLMEGHCCASPQDIPLLVNSDGYFHLSWMKLFAASYCPSLYKRYRTQLQTEITAQIRHFLRIMPNNYVLCLDSHQHTHVIPIVWDALMNALKAEKLSCEFIRIPAEPLLPYLQEPSLYTSYGLASWIKNIILNICSTRAHRQSPAKDNSQFFLWGIMMGCRMDVTRVKTLLPHFQRYGNDSTTLCILFHPGQILPSEITEEYSNPAFLEVETAANRRMEYQTLSLLHDSICSRFRSTRTAK